VKQPPRLSYRQLKLLESDITIRVDEKIHGDVIHALADLLLEALGATHRESAEVRNESED
jgi:hypothetical protein